MGIGGGGTYIAKDSRRMVRIGLDIDPYGGFLRGARNNYGVLPVQADASGERLLPFESNSFKHIEAVFPHDDLLNGLCFSDTLWRDLKRVLKKRGDLAIVVDVPWVGTQGVHVKGQPKLITDPQTKILNMSQLHGFASEISELEVGETEKYGTVFATSIAQFQKSSPPAHVYKIMARS